MADLHISADMHMRDELLVINILLFCPRCGTQHVDEAKGEWTNPPHATHTCAQCGLLWRPSNAMTNGVRTIIPEEPHHAERIANCWSNVHGVILAPMEMSVEAAILYGGSDHPGDIKCNQQGWREMLKAQRGEHV